MRYDTDELGEMSVIDGGGSSDGENMFMGPKIHLTEDAKSLAAQMKKGQKLAFLCEGVGEVVGTAMLKDCSIAEAAK